MSATIDYFEVAIDCPHCGEKTTLSITHEQDNRTGETSNFFRNGPYFCDSCDERINRAYILEQLDEL